MREGAGNADGNRPSEAAPARLTLVEAGKEPVDASSLLDAMDAHHSRIVGICDELEEIADSLPFETDPARCMNMARTLKPALATIHAFEEGRFFPFAARKGDFGETFDAVRLLLEQNHREDEGFAEELSEALADCGLCVAGRDAETTGYMLRGFFEGLRRHVALERLLLVDPLRARFDAPGE